jgi:hypothetical protein
LRFIFDLAGELHKTVREVLYMTTEELMLWRVYYDVRGEEQAEELARMEREAKKGSR